MIRRNRILVYSGRDLSAPGTSLPSTDDGALYFSVDSPEKLRELLAEDGFDAVIIDRETTPADGSLSKVLEAAAGYDIPVVVARLSSETDIDEPPELKSATQRLVLRRNRPESAPSAREEADIVADTAATLSHEINNPLLAITANVEVLLKQKAGLPDEIVEKIRMIEKAAERIRKVTHGLIELQSVRFRRTAAGRMIDLGNLAGQTEVEKTAAAAESAE